MPRDRLRPALRTVGRLVQLLVGLIVMGLAVTALKRAQLGLGPWDVFHDGIARHTGVDLGIITIAVGIPIMALWWPLHQRPGIGTIANVLVIGAVVHRLLPHTSPVQGLPAQLAVMTAGLALFALGQGLYLSVELGAGPRDGLMTGLHRQYGWSIRAARTTIETIALVAGIVMGGSFGVGTLIFAFGIGPAVQVTLRWFGFPIGQSDVLGSRPEEAVGLAGE